MSARRDRPEDPLQRLRAENAALREQQAVATREHARLLDEARALQAVAADLASAPDLRALLDGIVERTRAAFGADGVGVWLLDEQTNRLRVAASSGVSATQLWNPRWRRRLPQPLPPGPHTTPGFVAVQRARRPVFVPDAPEEARRVSARLADALASEGIVSSLRLPLFASGGRVIGMMVLDHRRERPYGEEEMRLAQAFADYVAVTLHNTRLTERERQARDAATRLAEEERSARAAAARQLERLATLTGITKQLLAATDRQTVLDIVVESASRLCDAGGAMVRLLDDDRTSIRALASHGVLSDLFRLDERGEPFDQTYRSTTATGHAIEHGETVVIEDYAAWRAEGWRRARTVESGVRAFIVAPLRIEGTAIGALLVGDAGPRAFPPEDIALVEALADQAALAIEQARLLDAAAARARERSALLDVATALTSTLELEPLLGRLLDQLHVVTEFSSCGVLSFEGNETRALEYRGPLSRADILRRRVPLDPSATWRTLRRGEAVIIDDVFGDSDYAHDYRRLSNEAFLDRVRPFTRAWLAVPLVQRGAVAGALVLTHPTPGFYTDRHAALALTVAHHAAAAIENARLYAESRQLAALEERARLARDLHDSVTQSVFSAGMLAQAAVMQQERGTATVGDTLLRVRTVLGDALSELRALLYELQPTALADEGLAKALEKLAGAAQVRTDAAVSYQGSPVPRLPPDRETAIFRIVQEALANAVKYARAAAIRLTLAHDGGWLVAAVEDDGAGFDPSAPVTPSDDGRRGGMGLRSMRERAAAAGLRVSVESEPGRGTRVTVEAPVPPIAPG